MRPEDKIYILENINKQSVQKIAQALHIKERKVRQFLESEKKKRPEPPPQPVVLTKGQIALALISIVFFGFLVYAPSLDNPFLWDDHQLVVNNTYIQGWSHIRDVFTKGVVLNPGEQFSFYRPLQMLTYMFNYSLVKLDVKVYHLTNILLHVLAAFALFWLISLLFGNGILAWATGLLFVIHPIHTEAVTHISGRADSLVAVFILLSLIFYVKYLEAGRPGFCLLISLSYAAALLSRENSIFLPVILIFYHYVFRKKIRAAGFVPVLVLTAAYIFLRSTLLKSFSHDVGFYPTTLLQRLPGFFAACGIYLRLLLFPFNLHMEYGNIVYRFSDGPALFGLVAVALLLFVTFIKRGDKQVFFSFGWFFLMLLPVSNLYPLDAYMAEHWLYLPSIGFFLVLAAFFARFVKIKNARFFALFGLAALVAFYAGLTIRQNAYWKDPIAFYERTLKYGEPTPRLLNNLGNAYNSLGRKEEAIPLYERAIELDPGYAKGYINLAGVYDSLGRSEEAIRLYEKALEIDPAYTQIYGRLASAYLRIGQVEKANSIHEKARGPSIK